MFLAKRRAVGRRGVAAPFIRYIEPAIIASAKAAEKIAKKIAGKKPWK